jgi:hypothetical protein
LALRLFKVHELGHWIVRIFFSFKKTGESDVSRASVLSCSADKYNDGAVFQKFSLVHL